MAGPGGGPPRKSHTKSRKGCKTCKRRHIRCDETFPQCKNCTKHNCRCDYLDQSAVEDEFAGSATLDLLMTPEIIDQLTHWKTTGEAPFPELGPPSQRYWQNFSGPDLRLLHHIASLSHEIHQQGYSEFTVWATRMPEFMTIARSCDFVMHAVLAFSASHLAWLTNNTETQHLAYHHRGISLKGLHEAIGSFSRDNSESILAASILLSWQALEWRDWASLQQGVSTVMNAMQPWLEKTQLGSFLRHQRSSYGSRTPVIPPMPRTPSQSYDEHFEHLQELADAIPRLLQVEQSVRNDPECVALIQELTQFVDELRRDFPVPAPDQAFERLQKLRLWLFWLPPTLLRENEVDLGSIAVLSHFFTVALLVEPLFPEIGGSYFGNMAITPIDQMRASLLTRQAAHPQEASIQLALNLTEYPAQTVMAYRQRQQSLMQQIDQYQIAAPQPFSPPAHHILRSSYLSAEDSPMIFTDRLFGGASPPPPSDLRFPMISSYIQDGPLELLPNPYLEDSRISAAASPYLYASAPDLSPPDSSFASQSSHISSSSPPSLPIQPSIASPIMTVAGSSSAAASPERRFEHPDQWWLPKDPMLLLEGGGSEDRDSDWPPSFCTPPTTTSSVTTINPTDLLWA